MQILRTYRTYVGELLSRKPGNASKSVVLLCQIHTGSKRYGLAMRWPLWRIPTRKRYSDLIIMRAMSRNSSPPKITQQSSCARRRHLRPLLAYMNTAGNGPHRRINNSPFCLPSIHLLHNKEHKPSSIDRLHSSTYELQLNSLFALTDGFRLAPVLVCLHLCRPRRTLRLLRKAARYFAF